MGNKEKEENKKVMRKNILTSMFLATAMGVSAQTQQVTVVELHPAPGQFVNTLPAATAETTHEEVCEAATESLADEELIHLGT